MFMLFHVNTGLAQTGTFNASSSGKFEANVLADLVPPVISNCPQCKDIFIKANENTAVVEWTPPTASDNNKVSSFTSNFQPGSSFPIGMTTVIYTATDPAGNSATCPFTITVARDIEPPVILNCPPNNITVYTGSNSTSCVVTATWIPPTATDNVSLWAFSWNYSPGQSFPVGTTTVTYTATDWAGNTTTCSFNVIVIDNTLPHIAIRSITPTMLWPPNHKMVTITANISASDNCSFGSLSNFVLESITSNEPDNGLGDGDTAHDIQNAEFGTPDTIFMLRAERSGKGKGRIYTITYKSTDAAGNVKRATATVIVPHNQ